MSLFSCIVLCLFSLFHLIVCAWHVRVTHPAPMPVPKLKPGEMISGTTDKRLNLIFPGTKWCGSGSVAEGFNDLGTYESTDMCCREHDLCPDFIEAGESRHGLTNNAVYIKLHCDCDEKLLECLKADKSESSYLMAFLYFNVLNTQCFREDYPIIECTDFYNEVTQRCKNYKLDTTATKLFQFFDVPMI